MTTSLPLKDTAEWLGARRRIITSSAIPILLGLSPYKSEQDLAEEMDGKVDEPDAKRERMFRLGHSLEAVIRDEDQIEHGIKLRSVNRFLVHPTIPWAATSLDFERVGERCIVEAKSSRARRWEDGLPQDVEAQVRWQMGVAGYPKAHIAVLRHGSELDCYDVEHDPAVFDGLVAIAENFLTRKAAGGPFAQNAASLRRIYPSDSGEMMDADPDLAEAVEALIALRERRRQMEAQEEQIEAAVKTRVGVYSVVSGPGWHLTWKRTKDRSETDWRSVADGLLRQLPEPERTALVGLHTIVSPGFRPLRIVRDKEA